MKITKDTRLAEVAYYTLPPYSRRTAFDSWLSDNVASGHRAAYNGHTVASTTRYECVRRDWLATYAEEYVGEYDRMDRGRVVSVHTKETARRARFIKRFYKEGK